MPEHSISRGRWAAKKIARMGVGLGGSILSLAPAPAQIRVVTYHRFGPADRMPFTVPADQFEREMAWLSRTRRALGLADVEAFLAGGPAPRPGSVLVTIDDGDPSVRAIALPILRRHGVPAVLYALGGRPAGFDLASEAELRELHAGGVTIGSHSMNHRSMALIPLTEARREMRESRARLEDVIGAEVTSFAYPFGTRKDVSDAVADLAAEAGYRTAFTSLHGPIRADAPNTRLLPRIKVESGDPAWLFPRLCHGAMDPWRLIDEGLSGLQKPAPVGSPEPTPVPA